MKSERERPMLYDNTYTWNLKKKMKQMNLFTKQTQTQMWKNKYAINKGEGGGESPNMLGKCGLPRHR